MVDDYLKVVCLFVVQYSTVQSSYIVAISSYPSLECPQNTEKVIFVSVFAKVLAKISERKLLSWFCCPHLLFSIETFCL